jgi:ribosome-associated toxin RatA of RatAB toxin-antitoxin module
MPALVSIRVEQPSTATPASVYDALMDLDRWPQFMPGVSAASW